MPDVFKKWLQSLSDEEAEKMWDYFDGSFTNCEDVIETLTESRLSLVQKVCGPPLPDKVAT